MGQFLIFTVGAPLFAELSFKQLRDFRRGACGCLVAEHYFSVGRCTESDCWDVSKTTTTGRGQQETAGIYSIVQKAPRRMDGDSLSYCRCIIRVYNVVRHVVRARVRYSACLSASVIRYDDVAASKGLWARLSRSIFCCAIPSLSVQRNNVGCLPDRHSTLQCSSTDAQPPIIHPPLTVLTTCDCNSEPLFVVL